MARSAFASFYCDGDSARVQQVLKMGTIEGESLTTAQSWESVKYQTDAAIEKWNEQMLRKSAVLVLVGADTSTRKWVNYEIRKAWDDYRPLVGIRIHGLQDLDGKQSTPGSNPFGQIHLSGGSTMVTHIDLHDPHSADSKAVYASIADTLDSWIANPKSRKRS